MEANAVSDEEVWMMPLIKYLAGAFLLKNEEGELLIKRRALKYTMVTGKLCKMGKAAPILRCLGESETRLVLMEVHEGVCGESYWTTRPGSEATSSWILLANNAAELVKKCDKCQRFSDKKPTPASDLTSVFAPWLFHKWEVDIVGPFPLVPEQLKFLIIGVDYISPNGSKKKSLQKSQQKEWKEFILEEDNLTFTFKKSVTQKISLKKKQFSFKHHDIKRL